MDSEIERAKREAHLNRDNPIAKHKLRAQLSRSAHKLNARLVCLSGPCKGRIKELPHIGQVLVGREPSADISVRAPDISRRQFQICWTEKGFWLNDLNSSSGTYVNGKRATLKLLELGDEIRAGHHCFLFEPSDVSPIEDSKLPSELPEDPFHPWKTHNDDRVFELETAFYGHPKIEDVIAGYKVMKEYKLHRVWRLKVAERRAAILSKEEKAKPTAAELNHCDACVLSYSRSIFGCDDCRPFHEFIVKGPVMKAACRLLESSTVSPEEQRVLSDIVADLAGLFFADRCVRNPEYYSIDRLSDSLKAELLAF
ncbi:MAG: FHA domain-containing protein [Planctomycetota bacterium]|nr:FHA domain-containing protein [Planctomycetota bacterium]